jgi:hypothetical protein
LKEIAKEKQKSFLLSMNPEHYPEGYTDWLFRVCEAMPLNGAANWDSQIFLEVVDIWNPANSKLLKVAFNDENGRVFALN